MSTAAPTETPTAAASSTPPAIGPLAGIRVLDLGTVYAAPITAMLAERVWKRRPDSLLVPIRA